MIFFAAKGTHYTLPPKGGSKSFAKATPWTPAALRLATPPPHPPKGGFGPSLAGGLARAVRGKTPAALRTAYHAPHEVSP